MSDQEKTEGCGDDTSDAFATAIRAITAAEIIERSIAAVGRINIDGPEAVAAAVHALNDMNKAGAVRIRLPDRYTVQRALAADLDGNPYPPGDPEAPATYSVTAVDANGCVIGFAALDVGRPWPPPTPEMQAAGGIAANEVCFRLFMAKWNISDAEQIAYRVYDAMRPLEPKPDAVTYYDISTDTRLPVTQEIFDKTERTMLKAIAARDAAEERCTRQASVLGDQTNEIAKLIAKLKDELAKRPAAFVDPDPPKLEHNPFKDRGHDPRRMGPL